MKKRMIALLLAAVMITCTMPVTDVAAETVEAEPECVISENGLQGWVPGDEINPASMTQDDWDAYFEYVRNKYAAELEPIPELVLQEEKMPSEIDIIADDIPAQTAIESSVVLPESYESPYYSLTPREQQFGTCWLFAGTAVIEANLAKNGFVDRDVDLSELQIGYFGYYDYNNPERKYTLYECLDGGNFNFTVPMANLISPVYESEVPVNLLEQTEESINKVVLDEILADKDYWGIKGWRNSSDYYGTEREEFIKDTKQFVYENGAAYTAFFYNGSINEMKYYGEHNGYMSFSHYYPYERETNHAVEIIGWDDNFSKSNFVTEPEGDGAFLIRNSWGELETYLWLSYYDPSIKASSTVEMQSGDLYEMYYDAAPNEGQFSTNGKEMIIGLMPNKSCKYYDVYVNPVYYEEEIAGYTAKQRIEEPSERTEYLNPVINFGDKGVIVDSDDTIEVYGEFSGTYSLQLGVYYGRHRLLTNTVSASDMSVGYSSLELSQDEAAIKENGKVLLTAETVPELDPDVSKIAFYSDNEEVATVDENGIVTPVGYGTCNIYAEIDGLKDTCSVTVKCSGFSLEECSVTTGQTITMEPVYKRGVKGLENTDITWVSMDDEIATIDAGGVLTGKKAGTVTVKAILKSDSNVTAECNVKVIQKATKIELSEEGKLYLKDGETTKIITKVLPEDCSNKTMEYSLNVASELATIDEEGIITLHSDNADKLSSIFVTAKTTDGSELEEKYRVDIHKIVTSYEKDSAYRSYKDAYYDFKHKEGIDDKALEGTKVIVGDEVELNYKITKNGLCNGCSCAETNSKVTLSSDAVALVSNKQYGDSSTITLNAVKPGEVTVTITSEDPNMASQSWKLIVEEVKKEEVKEETQTPQLPDATDDNTSEVTQTLKTKDGTLFTVTDEKTKTVTVESGKSAKGAVKIPTYVKNGKDIYKVTKIADGAFDGNDDILSIIVPAGIEIGNKSFKDCTALEKATIYSESVGSSAFKGCVKLKSISLSKNTKTIGTSAFEGCTSLKKITIPAKVTSIGKKAFYKCTSLKTVTIKSKKIKSIGKAAFKNLKKGSQIKMPGSKRKAYKKLLKGKYTTSRTILK